MAASTRLERIVNLIAILSGTSRPLSFADIRAELQPPYPEGEAGHKAFLRDKQLLRELGCDLVIEDEHGVTPRYQIVNPQKTLASIRFTDEELFALGFALHATDLLDSVSDDIAEKVLGQDPEPGQLAFPAPRQLNELWKVVNRSKVVSFVYGPDSSQRTVEHPTLLMKGGRWYLRGHCRERNDRRTFRVDRIHPGTVQALMDESPTSPPDDAEDFSIDPLLFPMSEPVRVTVAVQDPQLWRMKRRLRGRASFSTSRDGWTEATFETRNPRAVYSLVLEFGTRARIVAPEELRQGFIRHLRDTVEYARGAS